MATLYTRNRLGKQVIERKEPSEQFRVAFQSGAGAGTQFGKPIRIPSAVSVDAEDILVLRDATRYPISSLSFADCVLARESMLETLGDA